MQATGNNFNQSAANGPAGSAIDIAALAALGEHLIKMALKDRRGLHWRGDFAASDLELGFLLFGDHLAVNLILRFLRARGHPSRDRFTALCRKRSERGFGAG